MKFYNCHLQEVAVPYTIEWYNLPSDDIYGLFSHVSHNISKIGIDKNFCIIDSTQGLGNINNPEVISRINESDVDYLILNLSDHPQLNIAYLAYHITKPLIPLKSEFNKPDYYPYWALASNNWARHDSVDVSSRKPFIASFVNGKPRVPRVYAFDKLINKPYADKIDITWEKINFDTSDTATAIADIITNVHGSDSIEIPNMDLVFDNFFKIAPKFIKHKLIESGGYFRPVSDIKNGMDTGYLQIICESRPEVGGFLSEKIFKPIRGGQLFLVQGSIGTIQALRDMGFDTFDDLIDHGRYDNEPDWIVRTDKMLSVMDDIHDNIETMYFSTIDRRQKNIDLLKSQHIHDYAMRNIRNSINI